MRISRCKKNRISRCKKNKVSTIETISSDVLVCQVLHRVAVSSLIDIINFKLSCKKFNEIGEDKYIYQHVILDRIPIVRWKPMERGEFIFMNKCMQSGNPEIIYRLAVVEYFNKINPDVRSICENLNTAMKQGHMGAYYVTCIVLLLSGDEEFKQKGIKLIGNSTMKKKLQSSRKNLMKQLDGMWVKNSLLKDRPICCTTRHRKNLNWEEEDYECEACNADRELKFICDTYNWDL